MNPFTKKKQGLFANSKTVYIFYFFRLDESDPNPETDVWDVAVAAMSKPIREFQGTDPAHLFVGPTIPSKEFQ